MPLKCNIIYQNEDLRIVERENYTDAFMREMTHHGQPWGMKQYSYHIEYRGINATGEDYWYPSKIPEHIAEVVALKIKGK